MRFFYYNYRKFFIRKNAKKRTPFALKNDVILKRVLSLSNEMQVPLLIFLLKVWFFCLPFLKRKGRQKHGRGKPRPRFFLRFVFYSGFGAPTGQTLAQLPQSMHASASITYLSSPSLIASTGHSAAQAPQLMHSSEILYAMMRSSVSKFL